MYMLIMGHRKRTLRSNGPCSQNRTSIAYVYSCSIAQHLHKIEVWGFHLKQLPWCNLCADNPRKALLGTDHCFHGCRWSYKRKVLWKSSMLSVHYAISFMQQHPSACWPLSCNSNVGQGGQEPSLIELYECNASMEESGERKIILHRILSTGSLWFM